MRVLVVDPGVHEVLVRRAVAWGEALGEVHVVEPAGAAAAAGGAGPLVVVWADTPRLGAVHADGVRVDLERGAGLVVGPALDGGVYLMAAADPHPELIGEPFAALLERAAGLRLETGMLRHERRLTRPEDRRALLADPLLDPEVRAALEV